MKTFVKCPECGNVFLAEYHTSNFCEKCKNWQMWDELMVIENEEIIKSK